jgi:hypothetical protein
MSAEHQSRPPGSAQFRPQPCTGCCFPARLFRATCSAAYSACRAYFENSTSWESFPERHRPRYLRERTEGGRWASVIPELRYLELNFLVTRRLESYSECRVGWCLTCRFPATGASSAMGSFVPERFAFPV